MEEKQLVDTKRLARELGVTVRRVRQMVEEFILPPPNEDKRHDLERCAQRYRLYKYGTYDTWNSFYDELEGAATDMEKKFERGMRPGSTDAEIRAASTARRRVFEDMQFMAACMSKTAAERNMFLHLWEREYDEDMGGLIYHAFGGTRAGRRDRQGADPGGEGGMSAATPNSQSLPPAWQRLADDLERAFTGRADLQARARDGVRWLAANADVSRRQASGGVAVVLGPA